MVFIKNLKNRLTKHYGIVRELRAVSAKERILGQYFRRKVLITTARKRPVVLVQCVEDPLYFGLFGQIVSSIREHSDVRVEQYVLNSLRPSESQSLPKYVKSRVINSLLARKWIDLYSCFCDGVGYRSGGLGNPLYDCVDYYRAMKVQRLLKSKSDLIGLSIDDMPVGDLINDSYLRFKPSPTVNLSDGYLRNIIWQAHRNVRRSRKYFRCIKPALYLTSYCTYIQHGIAVRVALESGVPVNTVYSNSQYFSKKLKWDDWSHAASFENYAQNFATQAGQSRKLSEADMAMSLRVHGGVDAGISYMRRSAYQETVDQIPDVSGATIIFLHDFFDSPHVYKHMVFADFWEWSCFTIETLDAANIRFFVKPHPNQVASSDRVVKNLHRRYPNIQLLTETVSNKRLVDAGMACAVTVHGTVAHEMAYLGVPTIACGDHPHISFDFCRTARTREEYAELLRNCVFSEFDKVKMREQSLAFYYMHNINCGQNEKNLLQAAHDYARHCADGVGFSTDLLPLLKVISEETAFQRYILSFRNMIKKGQVQ